MKKLIITMIRDFGIFAIVGFILMLFVKPWETAISLLITAYVVIEIGRIMFRTDISYYTRRWPIVILFTADFICARFLLKSGFEKFQWIKIGGMLLLICALLFQKKEERTDRDRSTSRNGSDGETEPKAGMKTKTEMKARPPKFQIKKEGDTMNKSLKIIIRDFVLFVAVGLIIPHFILIKPRTLILLLTSIYLIIEMSRILPDPTFSFTSKRNQMILLTFIGFIYLCFVFADRSDILGWSFLVPGFLLVGWLHLLRK